MVLTVKQFEWNKCVFKWSDLLCTHTQMPPSHDLWPHDPCSFTVVPVTSLIPEGPALTNQTSEEEGLAHSELLLSPSSYPPCPSPASWPPILAVWSKNGWNEKQNEGESLSDGVRISGLNQGGRTFRASLREAVIFDFLYGENIDKFGFYNKKQPHKLSEGIWKNKKSKYSPVCGGYRSIKRT